MHYVIIGGGIVGLATAHRLALDHPDATVTVIEKERTWGAHQTGHNSGVIHAGVYYKPGSLKATLCKAGSASMVRFCGEHGIPYEICGKLIVATSAEQVGQLESIRAKAEANGVDDLVQITAQQALEMEQQLHCTAALHSPSTGIIDSHALMLLSLIHI